MAGEVHRETLGDYFTLQRGTTYKGQLLGQPGPVLLGLASIQRNGGFRTDSLQTYGGESPDKLLVHPGELYLSLKDVTQSADLLGAVARVPIDHLPGRLTQDTVKLQPKGTDVPLDYPRDAGARVASSCFSQRQHGHGVAFCDRRIEELRLGARALVAA